MCALASFASAAATVADAAMNRDLAAVRFLLQQKADVNAVQADGATALHWAARWDDVALTDTLIRAGANVKAANRFGVTPLLIACMNGNAAIIKRLLEAGVHVNTPVSDLGETALMMAARTGNLESVKVLLDAGADINAKETAKGATALMWAAAERHSLAVKALIEKGANVNERSSAGVTALVFATRENDAESVRLLVDAGANVNLTMADGTSALVVAVVNGHYELARFLLEKGGDPNIADSKGRTPLYSAIDMRNMGNTDMPAPKADGGVLDVIKLFLKSGANPNTPLTARLPYRGGINPSWLPEPGATPFYRAAAANDVTVMRLLLEHGADPMLSANDKTTPLMVAAGVGWLPGISYTWSESQQLEALTICLEAGHNINATNNNGLTALHGAGFRGATAAIRFLAAKGGRFDLKDKEGRTPLNYAEGIYFGGQPPRREEAAVVLIQQLMASRSGNESR